MKKTLLFLVLFSFFSSFGQTNEALDNNWYLSHIELENGEIETPVFSADFPSILFNFRVEPEHSFETGVCNAFFGGINYQENSSGTYFTMNYFYMTLYLCDPHYFFDFEGNFANFFQVDDWSEGVSEPFYYEIFAQGNGLGMKITNPSGDVAHFGNQILSHSSFQNVEWSIFPNPVSQLLNIQTDLNLTSEGHYQIFDAVGKLVQSNQFNFSNTHATLDVSQLNSGFYLITFNANGQKKTLKFLKE